MRSEKIRLSLVFILLSLSGVTLIRAGSALWATEDDLFFVLASGAAAALPGNIDVPVALFTGIIAGVLLLFLIDCLKRIQLAITIILTVILAFSLDQEDNIVETIADEPLFFLIGLLITLGVLLWKTEQRHFGDIPQHMRSRTQLFRLLHIPAASPVLYTLMWGLVVVVTVQYPVIRPDGPSIALTVLAGLVAIPSLAVLIDYKRKKTISVQVLEPRQETGLNIDRLKANVAAGIYRTTKWEYYAEGDSGDINENGRTIWTRMLVDGEVPDSEELDSESLYYIPDGLFARPTELVFKSTGDRTNGGRRDTNDPVEWIKRGVIALPGVVKAPYGDSSSSVGAKKAKLWVVKYPDDDFSDEDQIALIKTVERGGKAAMADRTNSRLLVHTNDESADLESKSMELRTGDDSVRRIRKFDSAADKEGQVYIDDETWEFVRGNVNDGYSDTNNIKKVIREL